MIHDATLLDQLSKFKVDTFFGEAFRATRKSLDPLAPSTSGGRWMPKGESSVLYTALSADGALAELTFHWGMLNPLPSKPAVLSRIKVEIADSLRILRVELETLGVDEQQLLGLDYDRMQKIGAAAAFLDCHGLIVPSARWSGENLIIFTENLHDAEVLDIEDANEVDWQQWGRDNKFLKPVKPGSEIGVR